VRSGASRAQPACMMRLLSPATLLLVAAAAAATSRGPKGVLMFFVDDMGYGDLGCFGAPTTSTPHIDLMASQGLKLTQWYSAAPLCTPSRAGLLSGRLPKRSGLCGGVFPCDASNGLPQNETIWPAVLQQVRTCARHCSPGWCIMPGKIIARGSPSRAALQGRPAMHANPTMGRSAWLVDGHGGQMVRKNLSPLQAGRAPRLQK
jgi:hypothetical protein